MAYTDKEKKKMDLEKLLNSIDDNGSQNDSSNTDSAVKENETGNPSAETTPVSVVENDDDGNVSDETNADSGVASASNDGEESETEPSAERKASSGQKRRSLSKLEKAEFSAAKWKRRAKEMQSQRDEAVNEFNKYKDLNPRAFDNDEDRMQFLAWKASAAQRISDMDADLSAMRNQHEREQYESKISDCYNERGAAEFEALDDHYGDAFSMVCSNIDPDNVIVDFLKGSRYEPAMRDVIYKNGELQEQLFKVYSNPAIAASKRLAILEDLERQVKSFYQRMANGAKSSRRFTDAPDKSRTTTAVNGKQPQETNNAADAQSAPKARRFALPDRSTETQSVGANRKVTGSLTRGAEPTGDTDVSAAADGLYRSLMGMA